MTSNDNTLWSVGTGHNFPLVQVTIVSAINFDCDPISGHPISGLEQCKKSK